MRLSNHMMISTFLLPTCKFYLCCVPTNHPIYSYMLTTFIFQDNINFFSLLFNLRTKPECFCVYLSGIKKRYHVLDT